MPITECPPNVWTSIPLPASGDTLLSTRGIGGYVSTSGEQANPADARAMPSNDAMVIASGIAIHFHPAQNVKSCLVETEGV